MFLKGDVIPIVQKWGSMPRHAGLETGLACTDAERMLIEAGTRLGCA